MIQDIVEHVRGATAWVADGPAPQGSPKGTAFFVAPGIAVTCAHVLHDAGATPHLSWRGRTFPADVLVASPPGAKGWPFPDAAVVRIDHTDHPVVPVADAVTGSEVWCYGITRARTGPGGRPEADGRHLKVSLGDPSGFLTLTGGAVVPGMSGGPVVDLDRYVVVGLTDSSVNTQLPAGGWASPIGAALDLQPGLRATVEGLDRTSLDALRRDQAALGNLPLRVAARLRDAADAMRLDLEQANGGPAPLVAAADVPEWVARQLFRLPLAEVVRVLKNVLGTLGGAAVEVFEQVAPCVRTREAADSHLVSVDSADDVKAELEAAVPRLLHVNTDTGVCARLLVQRAVGDVVTVSTVGGASAATSMGGLPTDLLRDLEASVCDAVGCTDEEWRQEVTPDDLHTVIFSVDPGDAPDRDLISGLAAFYPGLRIVIPKRAFVAPDGVDGQLHSVTPALDPTNEARALRMLKLFNDALTARGLQRIN